MSPSAPRSIAPLMALPALLLLLVIAIGLTVLQGPQSSRASFPGFNGDIAFDSDRFGNEQIFRMSDTGGVAVQLTTEGRNFSAVWSPDGTRIAFVSDRDGGNAEIYVMNADGSQETRLTTNPTQDSGPAWSADGSKIVFLRRNEAGNDIALWNVAASGGEAVLLIDSPGADTMPAYSPDGSKIAYVHNDPGEMDVELYVANADGSNPVRLTNNPTQDTNPNWSPDGSHIVYECEEGVNRVCMIDADGNNQHTLPTANPNEDREPAWSPDGSRIAFESYAPPDYVGGIYTMNPDGSDVQLLSEEGDYEPDWQPLSSPPLRQGDVDCDGTVTAVDALKELRFVAGLSVSQQPDCPHIGDPVASTWGDVDCTGGVNAVDALKILRHIAGLSVSQDGDCPHIGTPEGG
ncbi:MAG TPA: hypothetical protein VLS25_04305 [Dehalococcoidia bacterium]|nr:hypothetical protein [Dehalococcoidia bacterium]